ncbi:MAG: hypothetical protein ACD_39C00392G0004 [uncultured bacterium]|nr:MAG: hypothetical protein ACD_39C00392G0004 [uncultured bacterium]
MVLQLSIATVKTGEEELGSKVIDRQSNLPEQFDFSLFAETAEFAHHLLTTAAIAVTDDKLYDQHRGFFVGTVKMPQQQIKGVAIKIKFLQIALVEKIKA